MPNHHLRSQRKPPTAAASKLAAAEQPVKPSSHNKRRQPLATADNSAASSSKQEHDDPAKLLHDNVQRLIENLRQVKNEQKEAIEEKWDSEKNNIQNVYASAMVKVPRNIKAMTLAEFSALYKTDLLATLLQRPPQQQQQQQQKDDGEDDPLEQTLQVGTVLKGSRNNNNRHAKKMTTTAKPAPVAASGLKVAIDGNNSKRPPLTTPAVGRSRQPSTTPSGRRARHGEALFSERGSPIEATEGAETDTYVVATVTKKKRRAAVPTADAAAAAAQGQQQQDEEEEAVMALGINVGGGEYISLEDPSMATQLDATKKNVALLQLQQLKEQVDNALNNLQINNDDGDENDHVDL